MPNVPKVVSTDSVPPSSVGTEQLQANAVGSSQIAAGAITSTQIATGAVVAAGIAAGAVGTAALANNAVTSAIAALTGAKSLPVRAIGTVYQNTSGKLLIVVASITLKAVAAADTAKATGLNDTVTPPVVEDGEIEINTGTAGQAITVQITMLVPNNDYYEITSTVTGTGTVTLAKWVEYTL